MPPRFPNILPVVLVSLVLLLLPALPGCQFTVHLPEMPADATVTEDRTGGQDALPDPDVARFDSVDAGPDPDVYYPDIGFICQADAECVPRVGVVDQCHEAFCNQDKGDCGIRPLKDGKACDDGDDCTFDDLCDGGSCGGEELACDDENDCTEDYCEPGMGCVFEPMDGGWCDDDDPCTHEDQCVDKMCQGIPEMCVSDDPCEIGFCNDDGECEFVAVPDNPDCCRKHGVQFSKTSQLQSCCEPESWDVDFCPEIEDVCSDFPGVCPIDLLCEECSASQWKVCVPCGDGTCNGKLGENFCNCPMDCPYEEPDLCDEDASQCPPGTVCVDGVCEDLQGCTTGPPGYQSVTVSELATKPESFTGVSLAVPGTGQIHMPPECIAVQGCECCAKCEAFVELVGGDGKTLLLVSTPSSPNIGCNGNDCELQELCEPMLGVPVIVWGVFIGGTDIDENGTIDFFLEVDGWCSPMFGVEPVGP